METPDPLAGFKQDLATYRESRDNFVSVDEQWAHYASNKVKQTPWVKADTARTLAAEGLWVSGMASLFNLLETNYKAQERLVAEQLKHAGRSSEAADKVARWTKWLVVVTAALILTTAFVGLLGPLFAKAPTPVEVRLVVPGLAHQPQPPAVIRTDLQSPTRDQ
jgi:hypothetical protein